MQTEIWMQWKLITGIMKELCLKNIYFSNKPKQNLNNMLGHFINSWFYSSWVLSVKEIAQHTSIHWCLKSTDLFIWSGNIQWRILQLC